LDTFIQVLRQFLQGDLIGFGYILKRAKSLQETANAIRIPVDED